MASRALRQRTKAAIDRVKRVKSIDPYDYLPGHAPGYGRNDDQRIRHRDLRRKP